MCHSREMRGFVSGLLICLIGAIGGARATPEDAAQARLSPCAAAARYTMPEGVETGAPPNGVAAAELPGTEPKLKVPETVTFPLRYQALEDPRYHDTSIELGRVAVDRESGTVSLDGASLSDPRDADVQGACAKARTGSESAAPSQGAQ